MSNQESINQEIQAFKTTVSDKIEKIVSEFAKGKISREQFQAIYERYDSQLQIAESALETGSLGQIYASRNVSSTIAVRDAHQGKALGLMIYHNKSESIIETLGNFDLPMIFIQPLLQQFTAAIAENKFVDHEIEKISDQQWVLYSPSRQSIIVTLFHNEPSEQQIHKIRNIHRDFEKANNAQLDKEEVDVDTLARPFTVFVQKSWK